MSARHSMFILDLHNSLLKNTTVSNNYKLSSVCLAQGVAFKWIQQGIEYQVSGAMSKELNTFENCYKVANKIMTGKIEAPIEIKDKNIYAFSFYFDRLRSARLVEENGGIVSLSELFLKTLTSMRVYKYI